MKKTILAIALIACAVCAKSEVIKRDTVAYNGKYELVKQVKNNEQTGEVSVSYKAVLYSMGGKKVPVNKATYDSGKITHLVYNHNADGSVKIGKAINK